MLEALETKRHVISMGSLLYYTANQESLIKNDGEEKKKDMADLRVKKRKPEKNLWDRTFR